jgi:hypothetical protein
LKKPEKNSRGFGFDRKLPSGSVGEDAQSLTAKARRICAGDAVFFDLFVFKTEVLGQTSEIRCAANI